MSTWEGLSGTYSTIVADPPWQYEPWPAFSKTSRGGDTVANRPMPYSGLSVADIKNLTVSDLAADNAHLYLWTTNRYLRDSYDVAEAWGFRFSQLLVWCKPPMGRGPGGTFSITTEYVLFCRKGKLSHRKGHDTTWWQWSRHGHSVKPSAFLDIVEQTSPGPYVELFARAPRLGWDHWGHGYETAVA